MPMRQTIGISLAFLMISAGAIAEVPDKNSSPHPGQLQGKHVRAEIWPGAARFPSCGADAPARSRHPDSDSAESAEGPADAYLGPVHTTGKSEIGRAAWYNWVGSRTASGEILDWITPTAAHRSLPLASYAKVTNLDTGRAVVVKINDRGPYRRRFIIDLSPRAAEEIGVVRSGIAAVSVEPIARGRAPNRGTAPASETHVARADSEAIPYNQPAWVDPRLERPASKDETATSTEVHVARADSEAIPYNQPAWVDPRLERPASKDETAPSTEERVARADSGAIPYNQPAWVDPRLEQR
ncbi:MAG: septal ring lytic transglycosylase RlpA family protein [Stellaceae bacterium]